MLPDADGIGILPQYISSVAGKCRQYIADPSYDVEKACWPTDAVTPELYLATIYLLHNGVSPSLIRRMTTTQAFKMCNMLECEWNREEVLVNQGLTR